jgi:hypothetical protein
VALLVALAASSCAACGRPSERSLGTSSATPLASSSTAKPPAREAGPAATPSLEVPTAQPTLPAVPSATPSTSSAVPSSEPPRTPGLAVSALRDDAQAHPERYADQPASLDALFGSYGQVVIGTGEHPHYYFSTVTFTLPNLGDEGLTCRFEGETYPPPGLHRGDPILVRGKWSFERTLGGGFAPDGGPLHLVGCQIARR